MLSRNVKCLLGSPLRAVAHRQSARSFSVKEAITLPRTLTAVKYISLFNRFLPELLEDNILNEQIASLEQAEKEKVSESIDVIRTPSPIPVIGCKLCPHLLFVRRRVHSALLKAIREREHVVIVGNPGIGKSVFQQYYMARIFNEDLYGPLPKDYFGNSTRPELVVRQVGAMSTELYFVSERKCFIMSRQPDILLKTFEPERTVFLFEPGNDICEPAWIPGTPTSAYVSPNRSRYKEFVKRGAHILYNPVWDLDELLSVAGVMRSEPSFPGGMRSLYEDKEVEKRFVEFGGILRYCLPQHPGVLEEARGQRRAALREAGRSNLIRFESIEHPEVSHHLAYFKVKVSGPRPFTNATIDLINENVEAELRRVWLSVSFFDKVLALIRNDETGYMETACQNLYEDVVADILTKKFSCRRKMVTCGFAISDEGDDGELFSSKCVSQRVNEVVPSFDEMEQGVLYVPLKRNFPLGDMLWICDDVLYVANATRQSSGSKKVSGIEQFSKELGVPPGTKVCVCVVPKPEMYDKLKVEVPPELKKLFRLTVIVLEMPKDYGLNDLRW
eukprot:TRINITY_DN534_c1_g3_i1.p1 TRINITY_DN534_c1_g3~~TRINITY_DN534_c1_g3_i1.p1  ORF type:complete len:559 (-),score=62.77 TRINITY_DN534_c1_g3_i1:1035-2711(-)